MNLLDDVRGELFRAVVQLNDAAPNNSLVSLVY